MSDHTPLFDLKGNSSIGMLNKAKLVVREPNRPRTVIPRNNVQLGFKVGSNSNRAEFLGDVMQQNASQQ